MSARRTPLYDRHVALGARMVEFAGWLMPLSYRGAFDEHRAVRARCGLFDVSHMGEIEIRGRSAAAFCDRMTANAVARLEDGDGQYSVLCADDGGVLDDLILYRLGRERFLLVVNAANTADDVAWLRAHAMPEAEIADRSGEIGLVALQGPEAERVLRQVTPLDLPGLRPFTIRDALVAGEHAQISRTGYTGEDGFEIFTGIAGLVAVWDALLAAALRHDGLACGLAARDTLRLEAALPLCGVDMDRTTTPLEAGLGWVVKLGKGDFIGRAALQAQQQAGLRRRLVGIEMDEPGIPRHGQTVLAGDVEVGCVTSGMKSPSFDTFIGLAYVARTYAEVGTALAVGMRGRRVSAHVVERPFYRRVRGTRRIDADTR